MMPFISFQGPVHIFNADSNLGVPRSITVTRKAGSFGFSVIASAPVIVQSAEEHGAAWVGIIFTILGTGHYLSWRGSWRRKSCSLIATKVTFQSKNRIFLFVDSVISALVFILKLL
jgi:hypothetical protein